MVTLRIKAGTLEKVQERSGIKADDAFARSLSTTTGTIRKARNGSPVGAPFIAVLCHAYGLSLSDVVEVAPPPATEAKAAA